MNPLITPGYQSLLALQRRIHAFTTEAAAKVGSDLEAPDAPRWVRATQYLAVAPLYGGLHVEFYGDTEGEPFQWVLESLVEQAVADTIVSLSFTGPDEGANGVREWQFTTLLDSAVRFPRLRSLLVRPTEPADHNMSLIQRVGTIMEEGGEIARFVDKAPYLSELVVPNAPDASFFQVPLPHLSMLRVGGNFDTQSFIDNLASSNNLRGLMTLDFTESAELQSTWASTRAVGAVTAFSSYETLFASSALDPVRVLQLRNSGLSLEELKALRAKRPKLQFMVIQAAQGGYVSSLGGNHRPWRHLVQSDPGLR